MITRVTQMASRELALVETVDDSGTPVGSTTVAAAHTDPGILHRAFSVLLRDSGGRVLLQRRATSKTRFPGAWANTCCGHPAPGEDVTVAATRRLAEEMGVRGVSLVEAGTFTYQAVDPATGRVEYEFDHVLVGETDAMPDPDPSEVGEWCWLDPSGLPALPAQLAGAPAEYAPWLPNVIKLACRKWGLVR